MPTARKIQTLRIGVWDHGPVRSGLTAFVAVWVAVVVIALFQGSLSVKNPAFLFGDPVLCMAITTGAFGLGSLPTYHTYWFEEKVFQEGLVVAGYLLGVIIEALFRWRIEGLSSYQFSDWYHLAIYGPMFYWLTFGIIASAKAFSLKTNRWALWVTLGLVGVWFGLGLLNTQNFGKTYPGIGWPEVGDAVQRLFQ